MNRTPDNMGRPVLANTDETEQDGQHDCPECGDRTSNMVNPDEPLKDCYDHIEDGDLREHFRGELKEIYHRHYNRVVKLNSRVGYLEGQVLAHEANITKKNGQIMELLDAVRFLKTCLDEKAAGGRMKTPLNEIYRTCTTPEEFEAARKRVNLWMLEDIDPEALIEYIRRNQ